MVQQATQQAKKEGKRFGFGSVEVKVVVRGAISRTVAELPQSAQEVMRKLPQGGVR